MMTGETGFTDVGVDLAAIRSKALEAGRDYGRYLRDAESAGLPEFAYFVRQLAEEDAARAAHCQELLTQLGGASAEGRQVGRWEEADD